jgi:hypothetical protein
MDTTVETVGMVVAFASLSSKEAAKASPFRLILVCVLLRIAFLSLSLDL